MLLALFKITGNNK